MGHRDIKLENMMLAADETLKIIDFGLAHRYEVGPDGLVKQTILFDSCGSKSYAAPEVLNGKGYYGFPVDVWSCAICLFAMLAGFFPLDEATPKDWRFTKMVRAQAQGLSICQTIYGFYNRKCTFSPAAFHLLENMMQLDPTKRISIEGILQHEWVTGTVPDQSMGNMEVDLDQPTYRSLNMSYSFGYPDDQSETFEDDEEIVYRSLGAGGVGDDAMPAPLLLVKQRAMSKLV